MSITILSEPTSPNVTGTKLIYNISSSNSNQPQFQFITDVYESGSTDLLTRIYTYPNLNSSGVVEVGKILEDNLDYDQYWKVTNSEPPVESVKTFTLKFGEVYSTDFNTNPTIYPNQVDTTIKVFPGNVYKNEGSFDFTTGSIYPTGYMTNVPVSTLPVPGNNIYRDDIDVVLSLDDYHTLTVYPEQTSTFSGFEVTLRDNNYNLVHSRILSSSFTELSTYGIGPRNLIDLSSDFESYFNFFQTSVVTVNAKDIDPASQQFIRYRYLVRENNPTVPYCYNPRTRFAFINKYGFWDYYNVFNPLRKVTEVDRSLYTQTFENYSLPIFSYNITNRGSTQYLTQYKDKYEITTDWLGKNTSDWLQELFYSPEVFIQVNKDYFTQRPTSLSEITYTRYDFIPVVITNTEVDWNMNSSRQKLFQYTIQFEYSNQRPDR